MRHMLLAGMLAFAVGAHAQLPATESTTPRIIQPGSGSITDTKGNVWLITPSGSIQENGQWVPGGGGTAALAIVNDTVYGLDAHGRGWFIFRTTSQSWESSAAPIATAASAAPAQAPASIAAGAPASPAAPAAAAAASSTAATTTTVNRSSQCSIADSAAASGNFSVKNGQIIAPNGKPFTAEGINVYDSAMGDAQQILAKFPGVNFIRLAAFSYQDPSAYSAFIQTMTSAHVVVEIEDHTSSDGQNRGGGTGSIFTGQALLEEGGWYSALASAYANNPYVWFGTDNEPPGPADQLSTWEQATYDSIRTAGNNNIVLLEAGPGGGVPGGTGAAGGMTPSVFASMTNVVWDQHYYPWVVPNITDIGTIEASIASLVQSDQTITSADGTIPVLIAEYGPSTTGQSPDSNGMAVVQAVNASGVIAGRAAWNWTSGDCCNNLTNGGGSVTNPYGALVHDAIAGGATATGGATSTVAAAHKCAEAAKPLSATAANTAAVTQALTGTAQPGATPVALSVDSSVVPPAAAPSSAQSSTPAPAATATQTPQAQAAGNVQQGDAIGAAADTPETDQQVQSAIAQAQAAIAAANGTRESK